MMFRTRLAVRRAAALKQARLNGNGLVQRLELANFLQCHARS